MATYKIAVLGGDGIGQEVTPEAQKVLQVVGKATGATFEFESGLVGGAAIDATGGPLPEGDPRPLQAEPGHPVRLRRRAQVG
jgi:3-isopropylmalate dehydrogenase